MHGDDAELIHILDPKFGKSSPYCDHCLAAISDGKYSIENYITWLQYHQEHRKKSVTASWVMAQYTAPTVMIA
jgi:hypothetical protein